MTHAQFFSFHRHLHAIQIRNYLAYAVAILSGLCRFSTTIDPIATAHLANKAAALSLELFALEALEAITPTAEPEDKVIAECQWCEQDIKVSDGGLFEIEGKWVCNDCGYAHFGETEADNA